MASPPLSEMTPRRALEAPKTGASGPKAAA
jgi:hypothetical protein